MTGTRQRRLTQEELLLLGRRTHLEDTEEKERRLNDVAEGGGGDVEDGGEDVGSVRGGMVGSAEPEGRERATEVNNEPAHARSRNTQTDIKQERKGKGAGLLEPGAKVPRGKE